MLSRALALAERTKRRWLIAEVRARSAFSAWIGCDDERFDLDVAGLREQLGAHSMSGLSRFLRSAQSDEPLGDPCASDLPEWTARAELLACGRSDDANHAQRHARAALSAAMECDDASLRILTLIAVAETDAGARDASLATAEGLTLHARWTGLQQSIVALRANATELGTLQAFVDRRLRKLRATLPVFEVAFFSGELLAHGIRVELREKELELLLTIASLPKGIRYDLLLDEVWPELDGDAASNAFRASLYRLRKIAGDSQLVHRNGKTYELKGGHGGRSLETSQCVARVWARAMRADARDPSRTRRALRRGDAETRTARRLVGAICKPAGARMRPREASALRRGVGAGAGRSRKQWRGRTRRSN